MRAAFIVAFGIGCTKSDKQPVDTSTAPPVVTDTVTGTLARDSGMDDLPGGNPAKTREYLEELRSQWTTTPELATLDCDKDATHGTTKVNVAIHTHQLTYKVDWALVLDRNNPESAQSPKGHFIAKIVNRDPVACNDIGLLAKDTVYLWAGKTNKKRALAIFRIDQQGNAEGFARAFRAMRCLRPNEPTFSEVHLMLPGTCQADATRKVELYSDAEPPNLDGPLHDQGVWYSCPGGCCQASNFGPY